MKKKWPILLFFLFFFFSICTLSVIKENKIQNKYPKRYGPFFQTMKITRFTEARIPCMNIEIEGEKIETKVDLGSNAGICLTRETLDKIKGKKFRGMTIFQGIRGKYYQSKCFELSEVGFGRAIITRLKANEMNHDYENDARLETTKEDSFTKPAIIGWVFFSYSNLYLDCENSIAAMCDSIETLQKKGYLIDCIERPLIYIGDRLIGFEAITETGPLLCLLDTGCTRNFLNTEAILTFDEAFQNPENRITVPFLKIGSQDFGETRFIRAPLRFPVKLDAILGMEFIYYNPIFIDFGKGKIYFSTPKEEEENLPS